jgi:hypothetical protein
LHDFGLNAGSRISKAGDWFGESQTGNGDFAVAAVEGTEADGRRLDCIV